MKNKLNFPNTFLHFYVRNIPHKHWRQGLMHRMNTQWLVFSYPPVEYIPLKKLTQVPDLPSIKHSLRHPVLWPNLLPFSLQTQDQHPACEMTLQTRCASAIVFILIQRHAQLCLLSNSQTCPLPSREREGSKSHWEQPGLDLTMLESETMTKEEKGNSWLEFRLSPGQWFRLSYGNKAPRKLCCFRR